MSRANKLGRWGLALAAVLTAVLPFAAPGECAAALAEGLALCGGGLLASLFPYLIVSVLLVRSGAAGVLGAFLTRRPGSAGCGPGRRGACS